MNNIIITVSTVIDDEEQCLYRKFSQDTDIEHLKQSLEEMLEQLKS